VRTQKLADILPLELAKRLGAVTAFVNPSLGGRAAGRTFEPQRLQWEERVSTSVGARSKAAWAFIR
jgi:hypothetical protein